MRILPIQRTLRKYSNGFTLIELLVVIAIIALLVSILLPSLTKAKDLARLVTCKSNLHGVSLAETLYMQDEDLIPIPYYPPSTYWFRTLQPYLGIEQSSLVYSPMMVCPADETSGGLISKGGTPYGVAAYPPGPPPGVWPFGTRSYNHSDLFAYSKSYLRVKTVADILNPSQALLMVDSEWWRIGTNGIHVGDPSDPAPQSEGQLSETRHDGKSNLFFADGSVAEVESMSLKYGADNEMLWYGGMVEIP